MNIQAMIVYGIISLPVVGIIAVVVIAFTPLPAPEKTILIQSVFGFVTLIETSLVGVLASILTSATREAVREVKEVKETAVEAVAVSQAGVKISQENSRQIQKTHDLVNSQSEALLKVTGDEAFAAGVASNRGHTAEIAAKVAAGVAAGITKALVLVPTVVEQSEIDSSIAQPPS